MISEGVRRFHVGDRMSEMAIHHGTVYLAGQVAEDAAQDVRGQTRQVLAAVDRLLLEAGTDNAHILRAEIYLADMADFAAVNEIYATYFSQPYPARATVQVARLPRDVRVEIDAIAVLA